MLRDSKHYGRSWVTASKWCQIVGSDDETRVDEQKRRRTDGCGPDDQNIWVF